MPTEAQIRWLEHVRDNGPVDRKGRGHTPWRCMRAGWTEWLWSMPDGTTIRNSEVSTMTPGGQRDFFNARPKVLGEVLTDAGHDITRAAGRR